MKSDKTIDIDSIDIEASWKNFLKEEFSQPYFSGIKSHLLQARHKGKKIYPPGPLIFNAFNLTPVEKVKVVILGQDPYHNPGQAMGLSFSVPKDTKIPPSLKRIYRELNEDLGTSIPGHGDLTQWAQQGVLLLNAMLTVEENNAGSHRKIGWQQFTNDVIAKLSKEREGIVFLLWGNFAKSKAELIDNEKHLILQSAHPSPLAGKAFFGNHHFSQTNDYLERIGKGKIDWKLT